MIKSVHDYFRKSEQARNSFSAEHFYGLMLIYITVTIGFGLIYFLLSQLGIPILTEGYLQGNSQLERLGHAIYFSGVTLLTVGYGDITPLGIGKWIALAEALMGYILPAAFVVHAFYLQSRQNEAGDERKTYRNYDY
nr:potassium channel family protein [Salirhabdus salicampi]